MGPTSRAWRRPTPSWGVTLIDTAHAYGPETSERLIAEALAALGQDR